MTHEPQIASQQHPALPHCSSNTKSPTLLDSDSSAIEVERSGPHRVLILQTSAALGCAVTAGNERDSKLRPTSLPVSLMVVDRPFFKLQTLDRSSGGTPIDENMTNLEAAQAVPSRHANVCNASKGEGIPNTVQMRPVLCTWT